VFVVDTRSPEQLPLQLNVANEEERSMRRRIYLISMKILCDSALRKQIKE
jgi:hypothetical protein